MQSHRGRGPTHPAPNRPAGPTRQVVRTDTWGPPADERLRTDQIAMRLSHSFVPTLKETPAEAQIASHRLMLRAGLVRQTSAGIYAWLPLGFRVLKNIERIVREEQDAAGAQEVLMPTIQPAELWRESGRYDDYGKEMLRIVDRHDARDAVRPDQRGDDHRPVPPIGEELPRAAADPLPHPVEVPRRGAPALRRDARARVPDEGRAIPSTWTTRARWSAIAR